MHATTQLLLSSSGQAAMPMSMPMGGFRPVVSGAGLGAIGAPLRTMQTIMSPNIMAMQSAMPQMQRMYAAPMPFGQMAFLQQQPQAMQMQQVLPQQMATSSQAETSASPSNADVAAAPAAITAT